jgi:putative addiction module killer protein
MKLTVEITPEAGRWITELRDSRGRDMILARLDRMRVGNFGDWRSVGDQVSELRIHHGPGYRLYFTRRGDRLVVVLVGGDKSSQARDIVRAKALAGGIDD